MKYNITRKEREAFELMFRNHLGYNFLPYHDYGLREFENELGDNELFVIDNYEKYDLAYFHDYLDFLVN